MAAFPRSFAAAVPRRAPVRAGDSPALGEANLRVRPDGPRVFEHVRDLDGPLRIEDFFASLRSLGLSTDLMPAKAVLGIPMRHRGAHVGNFYLVEKASGGTFTGEDEETLACNTFVSGGGRHAVLIDLPADQLRAIADRQRIEQLLNNLQANANRRKFGTHLEIAVKDDGISWSRREGRIAEEARLDGIYVIRTSLEPASLGAEAAVEADKGFAGVERAFRNAKSDLRLRPVYVHSPDHVRAHVFMCMLTLHVEWHMRKRLARLHARDHAHAEMARQGHASSEHGYRPGHGRNLHRLRCPAILAREMALNETVSQQLRADGRGCWIPATLLVTFFLLIMSANLKWRKLSASSRMPENIQGVGPERDVNQRQDGT